MKSSTRKKWLKDRTMISITLNTKQKLERLGIKSDSFDTIIDAISEVAQNYREEFEKIIEEKRKH